GAGGPPAFWALPRRAAVCRSAVAFADSSGREHHVGRWVLAVHCAPTSAGSLAAHHRVVRCGHSPRGSFPSEPCRLRRALSRAGGHAGRTDSPLRRAATAWPSLGESGSELGRLIITAPDGIGPCSRAFRARCYCFCEPVRPAVAHPPHEEVPMSNSIAMVLALVLIAPSSVLAQAITGAADRPERSAPFDSIRPLDLRPSP